MLRRQSRMGILPGVEHDCFISYRHLDNLAQDGTPGRGWVSDFHQALSIRLGEYLGQAPSIWRDPRLDGNDVFPDELNARVASSAILVPIVSPGYRRSEWCAREFNVFREHAQRANRWTDGNKVAVMKVVRTPLDGDEHNVFPIEALGYWFFDPDKQTGKPQRFDVGTPPYLRRLEEIAQDLSAFLKRLATAHGPTGPEAPGPPDQAARPAAAPQPEKAILLACDVSGLDRKSSVIVVSCVAVDQPQELSRRIDLFKSAVVVDPEFSTNSALLNRIRRRGLHYEDDDDAFR